MGIEITIKFVGGLKRKIDDVQAFKILDREGNQHCHMEKLVN